MPLTSREAFKVGFLARCAQDGLSPDETYARVKLACDTLEKRAILGTVIDKTFSTGKGLAGYAVPAALLAPPVLGGLGGYALAKATDVDDTDVDAIKSRELIEEYRRQASRLRRQAAIRAYAQKAQPPGRAFM